MKKAYVDKERCKSCGLCVEYCKKGAVEISHDVNTKGYKYVHVLEDQCIGCGLCYTVCPDGVFTIKEEEA